MHSTMEDTPKALTHKEIDMSNLMFEDLARAHQQHLRDVARESREARRLAVLARAERRVHRAQKASERARRRLVMLRA
jgi:hypothetical protein